MWYEDCLFYQIYPLGFCGAPATNPLPPGTALPQTTTPQNRLQKVAGWIPHMQKLGAGAVLFNPLFESDAHGYDSRDLTRVDNRLGSNADFAALCSSLHSAGLKVVLDGVFNHVGRGFWAFQDVLEKKEASRYCGWFFIDFSRDSNYGDGFWYDGWENHYELVKLNLQNEQVVKYLLDCVSGWISEFDIDGLRLDVAYSLPPDFMQLLRCFTNGKKPGFFLVGEMLHGDYKALIQSNMLHSATNYECYKGLYSSFNSMNLFEIAYSLNRQFGPEQWTLYKGLPLFNFADNHDVSRLASVLTNPAHLPLVYGILFGMPGIPCLYYGSEWGATGDKKDGDAALRQSYEKPEENKLFAQLAAMAKARTQTAMAALGHGAYRQVHLTNGQLIFERKTDATADAPAQRVLVCVNAAAEAVTSHFDAGAGTAVDLLRTAPVDFGGGLELPPYSVQYLLMEQ